MSDEIKTAETNDVESQLGSHADVEQEQVNDAEFSNSSDSAGGVKEETPRTEKKDGRSSENAQRRREEKRQKELKAERDKTIISTLKGKNPYTGEAMEDSADVEEYLAMREIEDNGGDPVNDYSKHLKTKRRELADQEAKESERAEWFNKDREDFIAKHPEVKLEDLVNNKQFGLFAEGKVGNVPLSKIYEDFMELISPYETQVTQKAAQMLANQKASPGALSSTESTEDEFFTVEQVRNMSPSEVKKNLDKIKKSMRKWKKKEE